MDPEIRNVTENHPLSPGQSNNTISILDIESSRTRYQQQQVSRNDPYPRPNEALAAEANSNFRMTNSGQRISRTSGSDKQDQKLKHTKIEKEEVSLLKPLMETWGNAHEKTWNYIWKHIWNPMWEPIESFNKHCCDEGEKALCYCGCAFILIPPQIFYILLITLIMALIVVSTQAGIAICFAPIVLSLAILFTMVGIWPGIILPVVITILTIVTMPMKTYFITLDSYR